MAVDWDAVDEWLAGHALDEWDDTAMADAALLADMADAVRDHGLLDPEEVAHSVHLKTGGRYEWPWQNPEALAILADEPGFDLAVVLGNLPHA